MGGSYLEQQSFLFIRNSNLPGFRYVYLLTCSTWNDLRLHFPFPWEGSVVFGQALCTLGACEVGSPSRRGLTSAPGPRVGSPHSPASGWSMRSAGQAALCPSSKDSRCREAGCYRVEARAGSLSSLCSCPQTPTPALERGTLLPWPLLWHRPPSPPHHGSWGRSSRDTCFPHSPALRTLICLLGHRSRKVWI